MYKRNTFFVVSIGLMCVMSMGGCATEYNLATGQQESLLYGTEKEVRVGDALSRQVESQFKINTDIDINERIQRILDRIVAVCDRQDLVYIVKVIEEDNMNAVSLPGGYIYIFRKLYDSAESDDELAGVIAHEVGHITAKHGIKRMQSLYGYTLLQVLAVASGDAEVAKGVSAVFSSVFFSHSREDELQSDRLAVRYTRKAGYDSIAMIEVLKKIRAEQLRAPLRRISYWQTHPHIPERIAVVNQEISGKMSFKDYLNLTGGEK